MAKQVDSTFTKFDLSEEEVIVATNLPSLTLMFLQTMLANAAEKKINLTFDPTNPLVFAQQEAELTGEIGVLRTLLDTAADSASRSNLTQQ